MGDFKLMDGTVEPASYIVFAETPGFAIGIKPLYQKLWDQVFLGFRIRAIHKDPIQKEGDLITVNFSTMNGKDIANEFQGFNWKKQDNKRCSLVSALPIAIGEFIQGPGLSETGEQTLMQLCDALEEALEPTKDTDMIEKRLIRRYMTEGFIKLLDEYLTSPEKAQVIPFKAAAISKEKIKQEMITGPDHEQGEDEIDELSDSED